MRVGGTDRIRTGGFPMGFEILAIVFGTVLMAWLLDKLIYQRQAGVAQRKHRRR